MYIIDRWIIKNKLLKFQFLDIPIPEMGGMFVCIVFYNKPFWR